MKAAIMVPGAQGGAWDVRDVQRPVVGPGQVLVRVHASSINRVNGVWAVTAGGSMRRWLMLCKYAWGWCCGWFMRSG